MCDPVVCNFLTKTLCANGGRLGLAELQQHVGLSAKQLHDTLQAKGPQRFLLMGAGGEPEVLALSTVRVCTRKQCEGCERLHLCKLHLMGKCGLRHSVCKYSHDINSAENKKVLKTHELSGLSENELRILLLQNDPFLLPDTCQLYNKNNTCKQQSNCNKLHICRHFLQGECRYFPCRKSHNFLDTCTLRLLKNGGIDEKMASNIQNIYNYKHEESSKKERITAKPHWHFYKPRETSEQKQTNISSEEQKPSLEPAELSTKHVPPSEDPSSDKTHQSKLQLKTDTRSKVEDKKDDSSTNSLKDSKEDKCDEICLFYVWKYCKHNEKCKSVHFHLPYRWQIYNGITWNDLSLMEEIEKAYCDPKNRSAADIDFQTMTYIIYSVRRLCTPSSVVHPTFLLTTKWIWYWKNDQGQWTEYGTQGEQDVANSPSSDILENLYLADPSATVQFQAGLYYYQLNFKEMTQMNISSKTKRQVCRRPKFVSYEEVQRIKERGQNDFSIPNQTCPPYWDQFALPDLGYKEVEISKISSEYQEIKKQFEQTMKSYDIIRVLRIQNPSLWKVFQWHKEQMKRRSGGKEIKEKLLFHGTMNCLVKDICSHNFDWRICGSNGKLYGKGSYFARDASYSHEYCQSEGKSAVMFMARVLVGEYAQGKADYVRPPTKSFDGFQFYDSCVDNVADPSVYVVFEKNQVYPEYLIEYKEVQKKCIVS